jgi:hypothetical protein
MLSFSYFSDKCVVPVVIGGKLGFGSCSPTICIGFFFGDATTLNRGGGLFSGKVGEVSEPSWSSISSPPTLFSSWET